MVTVVLKYAERKCLGQIGSLEILTSEKCTVTLKEWVSVSILKIITVPIAERITQWMTASSPAKINIAPFKEWMNAILTVTKTDALLQRSDGCN